MTCVVLCEGRTELKTSKKGILSQEKTIAWYVGARGIRSNKTSLMRDVGTIE